MKIGVWLNKDHNPTDGGSFSFLDKLIKSIDEYHFSSKLEVVFISESDKYKGFSKEIIYLKYPKCKLSLLKKIHLRFSSIHKRIIISGKIQKKNDDLKLYYYSSILKKHNVDLIYYPRQCNCEIENYPFVATNWDIGHLSTYSFPEFDKDYDLVKRNEWFNKLIYKALYVFCESDSGRNELMKFTRLDESRLKVVPIFAGSCTSIQVSYEEQERILNNYNLSKEYFFFYPAQFWAHKNHFGLLQAFRLFVLDHPGYKLVFTGSDKGNRKYIESVTQDLGISDMVLFPGLVEIEVLNTFYRNCVALIMPTFLGPTNLPLLEALDLQCPVLCSDIPGHREIMSSGAVYFNPLDHFSILSAMEYIINKINRTDLYNQSEVVRKKNKFNIENALKSIEENFLILENIRKNWE